MRHIPIQGACRNAAPAPAGCSPRGLTWCCEGLQGGADPLASSARGRARLLGLEKVGEPLRQFQHFQARLWQSVPIIGAVSDTQTLRPLAPQASSD